VRQASPHWAAAEPQIYFSTFSFMLTDTTLRSQVDHLWDKLWAGGLSNPLDAIEQLSYLLFMKRLDDAENAREQAARRRGTEYTPLFKDPKHRWAYWTNLKAEDALKFVKETVFPALKEMGSSGSSFELQMKEAEFKINKPSLLIEACKAIDAMKISQQNQDVQGDLYEYLLGKLTTAKIAGQFRTPRHIIRMMVQMIAPRSTERICDPAAGTAGFLVNAYQYILEQNTSKEILEYDEDGMPHHLTAICLVQKSESFYKRKRSLAMTMTQG